MVLYCWYRSSRPATLPCFSVKSTHPLRTKGLAYFIVFRSLLVTVSTCQVCAIDIVDGALVFRTCGWP